MARSTSGAHQVEMIPFDSLGFKYSPLDSSREMMEFASLYSVVQTRSIWLPPDDNFVKLNFDGSYNPFTHDAGIRGIIRSSAGKLISAYSWKLVTDKALAAEIQALLKGVGVYIVDGLQNIIIEGDCLTLIDSLRRFGTLTWDVMVIWRKLILALTRIPRWEVRFCKGRET
ncbi:hypothetical protein AAC387_Pa02g0987 [Persea americana]